MQNEQKEQKVSGYKLLKTLELERLRTDLNIPEKYHENISMDIKNKRVTLKFQNKEELLAFVKNWDYPTM